jgi:5-methylcytosine-specific restriction endonuclease McrA
MVVRYRKTEEEREMARIARGKHQGSKWIRRDLRLAINLRDRMTCLYCSRDLSGCDPRDITLDHVKAKADGGSNAPSNLVTACLSCNSSKRDTPINLFTSPERIAMIRRNTRRKIGPYRIQAKAYLSRSTVWSDEIPPLSEG